MKKIAIILVLSLPQILLAQIHLSLRDNRYAGISYDFFNKYNIELEHSIFPEKIGFQYIRANIKAKFIFHHLTLLYQFYLGTLYNQNFYDVGSNLNISLRSWNRINIFTNINPHYDSGFDHALNYGVGLKAKVYKGVSLIGQFTTIPEYRISEKRIRLGLYFEEGNLVVSPVITIPAKKEIKSMRTLVSLDYSL